MGDVGGMIGGRGYGDDDNEDIWLYNFMIRMVWASLVVTMVGIIGDSDSVVLVVMG